jgi:patatin-like phospholipase/acyl hydrolase
VLKEIEEGTGKRIVDHFDLIAGTSTGGIIAIALGLGLSAAEILAFYRTRSNDIFPSTGVYQRWRSRVRRVFEPKYGADALEKALASVFGDRLLGESSCRLLIPSYDAIAGDVHVFKTRHDERVLHDHKRRAVEIALATSAAPTFLPMSSSSWGQKFLDGGVWANCPAALAVLEATAVLGVPLPAVQLLSIGTTTEPFSIDAQAAGGGLIHYRLAVIELLQQAQVAGSWAQARLLLRDRAIRIDSVVKAKRFRLDDARGIDALIGLGIKDGRHRASEVGARFLDTPAVQFIPAP